MMKANDISQIPVMKGDHISCSISDSRILAFILENPVSNLEKNIEAVMDDPLPQVPLDMGIQDVSRYFDRKIPAVMTQDTAGNWHVITQYDIIRSIRG